MVTAVVLVRTERERVQEAAQAMLGIEGVTEVYSVTGPYDLVVMVRIPDFERLAEIVPERLAQTPGVARTETMVAFRCYSNYDLDRIWSQGFEGQTATGIETARLLLRRWREEDVDAYTRMCADPEVMRHFPYVLTRDESEAQVERFVCHWDERGFGLWAVEEKASGAFIGFIGLQYNEERSEGEHKTEVGWRLDRAWWNRGLDTEGARASLGYGFEVLELECIINFTVPENAASRRVMEKCGLVQQGETRWRGLDHVWYAIDRRDREAAGN